MTVELRTTSVPYPPGGLRELWHFTDDVELDEDDQDDGALYWALVGATEGRELTIAEAIQIAEMYGGTWDEECEQLGMAVALARLADVVKTRGWVE